MFTTGVTGRLLLPVAFMLGFIACNKGQTALIAQEPPQTVDPASGNLAPVNQNPVPNQQVTVASQQPPEAQYPPAPPNNSRDYPADAGYDAELDESPVYAQEPPPAIPEYSQPECPGENYFWTPGYWNHAGAGYYWVPGAWVIAPYVGALWTPPYWGYSDNRYLLHAGFWGTHIGFYGGINYGFGYTGRGYYGAYWNGGTVYYNRNVTNVNVTVVHNVYNYRAPVNTSNRIGYNGGRGGIQAQPVPSELAARREQRMPQVPAQVQHAREAGTNRAQFDSVNRGRPQTLTAVRPLQTSYSAPAAQRPAAAMRPATRPAPESRPQFQPGNRPGAAESSRPGVPVPQQARQPADAPKPQERPVAPPQQVERPENRGRQEIRPVNPSERPAPQIRNRPEMWAPAAQDRPVQQPATPLGVPESRPAPPQTPRQENGRHPEMHKPGPQERPETRQGQRPENRPVPSAPENRQARPQTQSAPRPGSPPHAAPEHRPEEHKGR
jgi:hypothetical protein